MITRLSPARLVSTVMGAWFLATAFSQFLAAIIAQFTGVSEGGGEGTSALPVPLETVHVYGDVFKIIASIRRRIGRCLPGHLADSEVLDAHRNEKAEERLHELISQFA